MTHDTEWPASAPGSRKGQSGIAADRLAWCIRYLAEEARRGGFGETAVMLEAIATVEENDIRNSADIHIAP